MKSKELKELLKEMEDIKKLLESKDYKKLQKEADKMFENAIKEPCDIVIKKDNNNGASIMVNGKRLAILVALAGAEEGILKELNCSKEEFNFIKNFIGTKEVFKNE